MVAEDELEQGRDGQDTSASFSRYANDVAIANSGFKRDPQFLYLRRNQS